MSVFTLSHQGKETAQVVDSISCPTGLKGCILVRFDMEKPLWGSLQKIPGDKKNCSILEADLGEKWLLCVQPSDNRCSVHWSVKSSIIPFLVCL